MEEKIHNLIETRFMYYDIFDVPHIRKYDQDDVHIIDALRYLFISNGYSERKFSTICEVVCMRGNFGLYSLSIAFTDEFEYLYHLTYVLED